MIKVGIIGYGYSAKIFHLPLIGDSESFQLVSISTSQNNLAKEKYPTVSIYPMAHDLIRKSEAELIVITAPNDVHYSLAKACLEQRKHVILEKPMVTTSSEAEELLMLAEKYGLILCVFHNRRWDGDFLTVKKIVKNNLLGDIRFFESHYDRYRPVVKNRWREQLGPGTGIWFDLGSHLLDQALCLFGMPEAITARCLPLRNNSKTTDYFHVLLHYSNCEVILHASSFSAGPNMRFHIQGTEGSFIKYGYDPQEEQLKNGMMPSKPQFGLDNQEHFGVLYNESKKQVIPTENGCYKSYYSEIAKAITNSEAAPVKTKDVIQVLKLLELAEQSSNHRKTIIIKK